MGPVGGNPPVIVKKKKTVNCLCICYPWINGALFIGFRLLPHTSYFSAASFHLFIWKLTRALDNNMELIPHVRYKKKNVKMDVITRGTARLDATLM